MIRGKFFLIDPKMHKTTLAETCFNSFRTYFASREDKSIDWDNETIEHPLKIDNHNCGIFVINYIMNYCETHLTNFTHSEKDLFNFRQLVALKIVETSEII